MFNFCGRGGRVRGRLLRTRGLSPCLKVELLVEPLFEALDGDADLLHGVAHADGHRVDMDEDEAEEALEEYDAEADAELEAEHTEIMDAPELDVDSEWERIIEEEARETAEAEEKEDE